MHLHTLACLSCLFPLRLLSCVGQDSSFQSHRRLDVPNAKQEARTVVIYEAVRT